MYFDTHAHYYDERFKEALLKPVETLLDELFSGDVSAIINAGTTPETSRVSLRMAEGFPHMYATAGIHPTDSQHLQLYDALDEIETLLKSGNKKLVALGEIGLDYHYDDTDKQMQNEAFRLQMEMASRLDIPVVIHDRDAHADVLDVIRSYPAVRGVLHSYSGAEDMARELISRGYMISFSGSVTYGKKPARVAKDIPLSHTLMETDAPYLPPTPLRGTLNHSGNLVHTAAFLAELHGIRPEEVADITAENARKFFRISCV